MAKHDLSSIDQATTPDAWVEVVLDDINEFLSDHASCEKKASGMALNVASHYPDRQTLLNAMVDLAVEELSHYREVIRLMLERGVQPGPDVKDPYIHRLNQLIRRGTDHFMLDRLLVGAVVERRGAERFDLLANALQDPALKKFYGAITASEQRHWTLFVDLAATYYDWDEVHARLVELAARENEIMLDLPIRPALH